MKLQYKSKKSKKIKNILLTEARKQRTEDRSKAQSETVDNKLYMVYYGFKVKKREGFRSKKTRGHIHLHAHFMPCGERNG